jgi:hypothetical protein
MQTLKPSRTERIKGCISEKTSSELTEEKHQVQYSRKVKLIGIKAKQG